ncbi:MAG: hypothetical protein O3C27_18140 [Actinomycetota bacterium]|nr:hypothetical protein [Actinomycetota bacterium]
MNTVLDLEATEAALVGGVVAFEGNRDVIEVDGPDAGTYLQGQISQDVLGLDVGASAWSFVLAPQGKVDAWFRVTRTSEHSFLLDLDAGFGDAVLTRLRRFKLRTKADLTLRTARSIAVRGPAATPVGLGGVGPDDSQPHDRVLPAAWPGIDGFDVLDPSHDPAVPFGDPAALLALRIRTGQPAMGAELDEHTIPAEAGVVDASVSFTKGCYVGQELVARVDSRGNNTPRKLLGIRLHGSEAPLPGAEVVGPDGAVGVITSSVATSSGVIAMAYIKRGTDPGVAVRVALASGSMAEGQLHSFPL